MKYFSRTISSKYDFRQGRWTCNAYAIGVDTSDDNSCTANLHRIGLISAKADLTPYIILYKIAPHGFNRVDKYKGLSLEKSMLCLEHCLDFHISVDGCEYMYACSEINPTVADLNEFEKSQAVIFLGNEEEYHELMTLIPNLKSITNIENYLILSGMVIVEVYDTIDIGSTLWLISNDKKVRSLSDVLKLL